MSAISSWTPILAIYRLFPATITMIITVNHRIISKYSILLRNCTTSSINKTKIKSATTRRTIKIIFLTIFTKMPIIIKVNNPMSIILELGWSALLLFLPLFKVPEFDIFVVHFIFSILFVSKLIAQYTPLLILLILYKYFVKFSRNFFVLSALYSNYSL